MKNKRILSLILALVLVIGATFPALAEELPKEPIENKIEFNDFEFDKETKTITGYKGKDKELVIPSEIDGVEVKNIGKMAFSKKGIEKVVFPSSLKKIGEGAFLGNSELSQLKFNEGLDTIGDFAFSRSELKEVEIPSSVRKIGKDCFLACNIEKLKFNEGRLSVIGNGAFKNNKLESVEFPSSLRFIDDSAFSSNNLKDLNIKGNNLIKIGSRAFANNKLEEVEIPNSLKFIISHSFGDNPGADGRVRLKFKEQVKIDKLEDLEEEIVLKAYCQSVQSQEPEGVGIIWKELENGLLVGEFEEFKEQKLGNKDLKNIVLYLEREEKPLDLSDFEFDKETKTITGYKGKDKELVIPSEIDGVEVKNIGKMAFRNKGLVSLSLPEGLERIESQMAFASNDIRELKLPKSLKYIGKGAFLGNKNLNKLELNQGLEEIDDNAFAISKIEKLYIPGSVKVIGKKAFTKAGLKELKFAEESELKLINSGAFENNDLEELVIPRNVELIENIAFKNNKISKLKILGNSLNKIGAQTFAQNKLKQVEVPSSLGIIHFQSFRQNPGIDGKVVLNISQELEADNEEEALKKVEKEINIQYYCESKMSGGKEIVKLIWEKEEILGNTVTYAGRFDHSKEETEENEDLNKLRVKVRVRLKNLNSKEEKITGLVVAKEDKKIYLDLADYMRAIALDNGNKDFLKDKDGKIKVTKLASEHSFVSIEEYNKNFEKNKDMAKIFSLCEKLTDKEIENLYKLDGKIEGSATKLVPVFTQDKGNWTEADFIIEGKIVKGLSVKGKEKILENKNLILPEGIEVVDTGAFAKLGIESIDFPGSLKEIKFNGFMGNKIEKLHLPGNIKKIGKSAFASCGIMELNFAEGLEEIGEYTFANNNIYSLELPKSLKVLKEKAFYQSNIHEVKFNEGLELIGNQSFEDNRIDKLILPKTLKGIDVGAFVYNNVSHIDFPYGTKIIGPKSFGVNALNSVRIPETVEWICPNAFRKNPGFEKDEFRIYIDQKISLDKELTETEMFNFLNKEVKIRAAVFEDLISKTKHPIDLIDWELIEKREGKLIYRGKFDRLPEDKLKCGFGTSCEDVVSNTAKISLIVEVDIEDGGQVLEDELDRKGLDKFIEKAKGYKKEDYTKASFKEVEYALSLPERYQVQIDRKIKILSESMEGLEPLQVVEDDIEWLTEDFLYDGDSLLRFSEKGFEKFKKSKFIKFPEKTDQGLALRKIADKAFENETKATEEEWIIGIDLPDTLEEIGDLAFRNNNIKELDLTRVKKLGKGAFARNIGLNKLELSGELKEVPNGCFSFSSLTELVIPEGVEKIGGSAFNESKQLSKLSLPRSLKSIESRAFTNINAFDLVIPGSVEKIEKEAFSGGKLSSLELEEGIKYIGKRAFKRNKIGNIIIPASVEQLEADAFDAIPNVNIQYRLLLDIKEELEKLPQTAEIKTYLEKIDQLNQGQKGRLKEVFELIEEINKNINIETKLAA